MKLILLIFIFTVTFGFVQNSQAQTKSKSNKTKSKSQAKNRAPSRSDIESLFGQTIDCRLPRGTQCFDASGEKTECPKWEGYVCFKSNRRTIIRVEFNSAGFAKRIINGDGADFYEANSAAIQIIMLNGRGRLLKREQKTSPGSCAAEAAEEYEYLTMNLYSKSCLGSIPGGVTIIWKE